MLVKTLKETENQLYSKEVHMPGKTHLTKMFPILSLLICLALLPGCAVNETYVSSEAEKDGSIVIGVTSAQNTDPFQAGKQAAEELRDKTGQPPLHTVVLAECFEDEAQKKQVLKGVCSVLPKDIVFGFSTYGSFAQQGCLDLDSVSLLGIAGDGIATSAALQRDLGIADLTMEDDEAELTERLHDGGSGLAAKLPRTDEDRLMVIMADAHSPKNQLLLEGAQDVMGKDFPITGGSANKNSGQTFVYFQGRMYTDSAIALIVSSSVSVATGKRLRSLPLTWTTITNSSFTSASSRYCGQGARSTLESCPSSPHNSSAKWGTIGDRRRVRDSMARRITGNWSTLIFLISMSLRVLNSSITALMAVLK